MNQPQKQAKASFLYTFKAVIWSFFGLRRKRDFDTDIKINPLHIVLAGLIGVACFIGLLLLLVRLAVAK